MSTLTDRLEEVKSSLKEGVTLIAVSKTKPNELIEEAYAAGQRDFGENKVQELTGKAEELPKDIRWHMIGHLQSNKVKYIAPFVHLIHGVDKVKLLKEINKRASQSDRVIDVLLQVHIAQEDTKFGYSKDELIDMLESDAYKSFENVRVRGLMGMATNTDNSDQVRNEFTGLKELFDEIRQHPSIDSASFDTLSMGMSGDYQLAMDCGSNMVRIGSTIFGQRN